MRFKHPYLVRVYTASRAAGRDLTSEMYYRCFPHRGAAHRAAYWNGRSGIAPRYERQSMAYAAWRAGADDLKEFGPVMFSEFPVTISHPAALKANQIERAQENFVRLQQQRRGRK